MAEVYGWAGTILRVNLTTGMIGKQPFSEELRNNFIGGSGLSAKILYDETRPETDPLGPDNRFIVSAGALNGTLALGSSRTHIMFKSPLTNTISYASAGGYFTPELKYAGYDSVVVEGRAVEPVYIWIEDDKVEIRDARHLWGKTIDETNRLLREEHGPDIRSLSIGPAGENLVKFASPVTDDLRTPSRGGGGCVMGSKNLKSIVIRGTKSICIADSDKLLAIEKEALAAIKTRAPYEFFRKYGTNTLRWTMIAGGTMGEKNSEWPEWPDGRPTYSANQLSDPFRHDFLVENYSPKYVSCFGCPLHCSAWFDLDERFGRYACKSDRGEGTRQQYGWKVDKYAPVVYRTHLCDLYGLDVLSLPSVISCAVKWYEQGIITGKDTDGMELSWEDNNTWIGLIPKIARREGFGNILAEGAFKAAEIIGAPIETAPATKGLDHMHASIPLARSPDIQLQLSVAARGKDHLSGSNPMPWNGWPPISRWAHIYKKLGIPTEFPASVYEYHPARADVTIIVEDEMNMANMLGTCTFNGVFWCNYDRPEGDMPYYSAVLTAATGVDFTPQRLIEASERYLNLAKAYNVRLGLGRRDDHFDPGCKKPQGYNEEEYDKMLSRYYELHGWDPDTGIPRRDTLEELGLKNVADDLEKRGIKLGEWGHKYDINDIPLELRGIKGNF